MQQSLAGDVCLVNLRYLSAFISADRLPDFTDKPKLPSNFEEVTWLKIKEAVTAIHLEQTVSCNLEELYRVCENFTMNL